MAEHEAPQERVPSLIKHACVLSGVAFALHFGWENLQCQVFFVHGSYDASWSGMIIAALGDVGLTWMIYAFVALVSRRWRWAVTPWSWKQIAALVVTAAALAVAIELRALETGRWSYNERMPLLPVGGGIGIGIVPLVQLVLLSPIVIALGDRFVPSSRQLSATDATMMRYDRIAPIYDALEWLMELRFRPWRRELWSRARGQTILELGIGTGKNLDFYPSGKEITAIDISERMIKRARRRAAKRGVDAQIQLADAQALPFPDATFDVVIATFLLCSVPDPVLALQEARRVLKPGGQLFLLEHVISRKPVLRTLMRWLDPISFHIWGAHITRDTALNVRTAGFEILTTENKSLDIVKIIVSLPVD